MSIIKGAEIIEKHISIKKISSLDSKFSLNEVDIKSFRNDINSAYNLIKRKEFSRTKSELENRIFRRSIYSIKNIKKGEKFTKLNIKCLRPNIGLGSEYYFKVLNKKSPLNIRSNNVLSKKILKHLKN